MPARSSEARTIRTRLNHLGLAAGCLPGLLLNRRRRRLLADMRAFCRRLPAILQKPLRDALAELEGGAPGDRQPLAESTTRELADLAALLERSSPLGLCLRRSLIRYRYLHQLEVPLTVNFGAKFAAGKADREVTGHAWLTQHNHPYHEPDENWRGFTIMFSWPEQT